jgi:hypothetical protein
VQGPYQISEKPIFEEEFEDPFLWQQGHRYYLLAKDMHARLAPEEGALVVIPSLDGIHFDAHQAMIACPRSLSWKDGGTLKCGHMERPSLILQNGHATHLCVAIADCDYGFRNLKDTWNAVIPLEPLSAPAPQF